MCAEALHGNKAEFIPLQSMLTGGAAHYQQLVARALEILHGKQGGKVARWQGGKVARWQGALELLHGKQGGKVSAGKYFDLRGYCWGQGWLCKLNCSTFTLKSEKTDVCVHIIILL